MKKVTVIKSVDSANKSAKAKETDEKNKYDKEAERLDGYKLTILAEDTNITSAMLTNEYITNLNPKKDFTSSRDLIKFLLEIHPTLTL